VKNRKEKITKWVNIGNSKNASQFLQDKDAAVAATRKPRWGKERNIKVQTQIF